MSVPPGINFLEELYEKRLWRALQDSKEHKERKKALYKESKHYARQEEYAMIAAQRWYQELVKLEKTKKKLQ